MKSFVKGISLFLLLITLSGCDLVQGMFEDPSDKEETYVERLVDDFIHEFDDSSRVLTELNLASMRGDILKAIKENRLEESEKLSQLMPIIASSAQISLKTVTKDSDKIIYIKAISKASIKVLGSKIKSEENDGAVKDIVTSVSVAMVENISEAGLPSGMIKEAMQGTLSSIISSLDSVHMDQDMMLVTVPALVSESTFAVSSNDGITSELLTDILATLPVITSKAVESVQGVTLNDDSRKKLLTASYVSVVTTVNRIEMDPSLVSELDVTTLLVTLQTETTEQLSSDSNYSSSYQALSATLLAETIAVAGLDDSELTHFETEIITSDRLNITKGDFENAIKVAEQIKKEHIGINKTAEEFEEEGDRLLKSRDFDSALLQYQKAINTGQASSEATLWWSMLTLLSISVDEEIQEIAKNIGLENYPAKMDDMFWGESGVVSVYGNDSPSEVFDLIFPRVRNQEMFNALFTNYGSDSINVGATQLLAVMYNIQDHYPDGLNSIVDSLMSVLNKMDKVVEQLVAISDDTIISYTYDMFEGTDFVPGKSLWPTVADDKGNVSSKVIKVGKAEVYSLAGSLEFLRSMLLLGQSLSYSLDFDGYWGNFNPLDGAFYSYDPITHGVTGLNQNFDWSTVGNPLADNFLYARANAGTLLAKSKGKFINSINYIDRGAELLVARDDSVDFYISPANDSISESLWLDIKRGQEIVSTVADKVIDSVNNGTVIYLPNYSDFDSLEKASHFIDPGKWPKDGYGINLGVLFSKPLLAIDTLFDIANNGEPVFYINNSGEYDVATKFKNSETYYIKFKDLTFNDLLVGFGNYTEHYFDCDVLVDGSVFIPLRDRNSRIMVGSSLTPIGETFYSDGKEYLSRGSFFAEIFREGILFSTIENSSSDISDFDDK